MSPTPRPTRWSDRTAFVAAAVAIPVTAAAAVATVVVGDPTTVAGIAGIAVPGVTALVATALTVSISLIRRHRERERATNRRLSAAKRELHDEKQERAVLRELDIALDAAPTEHDAITVIRESFSRHLSMQPMELHLVDALDPVMELTLAAGDHTPLPPERTSPWDSLAARTGTTLVYESTDRLDVCPHLLSRLDRPMSAIAVPITIMGQLLGVLYGLGPDGQHPGAGDVTFLEDLARLIGGRIAVLRATAASRGAPEEIDKLTGLPDRSAMQDRILRLLRDRQPFTVAVADIDGFVQLNDLRGRETGDRVLQAFGRVARRTIRPGDLLGRIGGDEFLFAFPKTSPDDATRACERLREELVIAHTGSDEPAFTVSFGVIGSASGSTIEEILHRAAGALDHARHQGGNRVVVAHSTRERPPT